MDTFRILVMGLPGSGKTPMSEKLVRAIRGATHLNADNIRREHNDWDFSVEGRLRQAQRMRDLADRHTIAVADFVCPTVETRKIYDPHVTIFLDTIQKSRYEDTNTVFIKPSKPDFTIRASDDFNDVIPSICRRIERIRPQGVMIGRYQPFHDGHRALFEKILEKSGFVCIMVREMPYGPNNPLSFEEVRQRIDDALATEFAGRYSIIASPNVSGVYYGRDVGYEVEKIQISPHLESISATAIRQSLELSHAT